MPAFPMDAQPTSSVKELVQNFEKKRNSDLGVLLTSLARNPEENFDAINRTCMTFTLRLHITPLSSFVEEPNVNNAMDLFWDVYKWGDGAGGSFPPDPSIDAELYEGMSLELFERIHEESRVRYKSDRNDSHDLERLLVHLHMAGARALRIRDDAELSEEALDCYAEVSRTYERARRTPGWSRYAPESRVGPLVLASTLAVAAMCILELSRFRRRESGGLEKALQLLCQAIGLYKDALWNIHLLDEARGIGPDLSEEELAWHKRFKDLLTGLDISLHEAASLYYALDAGPAAVNDWHEIARMCGALFPIDTPGLVTGYDKEIEDPWSEGEPSNLTWNEFWVAARTRAQGRLSPCNYQQLWEAKESREAESRLTKQFHTGASWESLSERARRHLVNADMILYSTQIVVPEALLNNLLIATEEVFSEYIWEPLCTAEWDPGLYDFEELRARIESKGRDPGISDFIWVCEQPFFQEYLERREIGGDDLHFLTEELPGRMKELRDARNQAQHEIGHLASKGDAERYFRTFIGIGGPGVLPVLNRIGLRS